MKNYPYIMVGKIFMEITSYGIFLLNRFVGEKDANKP